MSTLMIFLIFIAVFTVMKISGLIVITRMMKPTEEEIEEARQKRLQAEKEGKVDTFEDWDAADDEDWK